MAATETVPALAGSPFQIDIRLFGTEGMLLLDTERERLWLRRNDGEDQSFAIEPGQGPYTCTTPIETFVDLCRSIEAKTAARERSGCGLSRLSKRCCGSARPRAWSELAERMSIKPVTLRGMSWSHPRGYDVGSNFPPKQPARSGLEGPETNEASWSSLMLMTLAP